MTEHTGASYEGTAKAYAEKADAKPWNAYYERPAVLSLLPPLANTTVLDAGCGSGWYAEYLLAHGAAVTAFDFNADFVALTQSRVGDRARVLQADLAAPLDFAAEGEFDLVVCPLVMHYQSRIGSPRFVNFTVSSSQTVYWFFPRIIRLWIGRILRRKITTRWSYWKTNGTSGRFAFIAAPLH
jgi:SAM-dependent methyltransferase